MNINSDQILSVTRSLLTLAGGLAVAFGYVDATTANALSGEIIAAVGAVLTAGASIWGVVAHNHDNQIAAGARSVEAQPDAKSVAPVAMALVMAGADVDTSALPANKPTGA